MAEYRRKQYYIDRIFQNKFLLMFLLMCVSGAVGNVLFLYLYLKRDIEDSMFRSRILIGNVNEVLISNVVYFNAALLIAAALFAGVFYLLIRRRVKHVLDRLDSALEARIRCTVEDFPDVELPREFEGLQEILGDFFARSDRTLQMGRDAIGALENFAEFSDDRSRRQALEKIDRMVKGE